MAAIQRNTQAAQIEMTSYRAGKLLVRLLFGCVTRVHVIRPENANRTGGFLLAANHISHFDPFIISLVIRRKIDWLTMAEFFQSSVVGFLLRAVDAFPVDRDRANRTTIQTAIDRLKKGRVVGLFPEGGIRDGARSLLEGAPLRPGASILAHIAGVPILPCVILGSDRLYSIKSRKLSGLRRTPVWIAFGNPISHSPGLEKSEARERVEAELASSFKNLYGELQQTFHLTRDDLPHSPRERMSKSARHPERSRRTPFKGPTAISGESSTSLRGACPKRSRTPPNDRLRCATAKTVDTFLCASINLLHTRHKLNANSRAKMERYVEECERLTADQYYASVPDDNLAEALGNGHATITWR